MNGEVLGNRYELLEKVGEGGMAIVYKARCNKLNRFVAVKILKKEYADNKEIVDKFKNEAMAVAKLSDSNIVNVLDVGTDDNENYIVMEYVNGKTLKELVEEYGKLNYDRAVTISLQIANALECAHKNGIVHRDIKPQNILVTEEGIAKVTDFGIAKSTDSGTLTNTSTILGSAHYFSPEQAKGAMVDFRSDIYSLGIVMYEMVTGDVPFDGESPVTIALKHIQENPINPRIINPKIPDRYSEIILKCMEKDVNDRYSNVKELIEDLKKIKSNSEMGLVEKSESSVGGETIIMTPIKDEDLNPAVVEPEDSDIDEFDGDEEGFEDYYDDEDDEYEDDEYDKKIKKKKTNRNLLIGIAIAVVIIVLGVGSFFMFVNSKPTTNAGEVQVPNIIGMNQDQAVLALKAAKLVPDVKEVKNSEPKGTVLNSNPSPGTSVKEGSTVTIDISKGEEEVTIPDLNGYTKDQATQELKSLGFNTILYTSQFSSSVSSGQVIAVTPQSGTQALKTSEITLVISKGPQIQQTTVPNVSGMSESEAKAALSNVNLAVNVETVSTTDPSLAGKVISVSPGVGATVNQGTSVTIQIGQLQQVTPPQNSDNSGTNQGNQDQNQGNTDQNKPGQGNTDQNKPSQGNTDQNKPSQGNQDQNNTDQNKPNQGNNSDQGGSKDDHSDKGDSNKSSNSQDQAKAVASNKKDNKTSK
ncbi:Stk1 family PASTA domain-containing Ser/Thr kinase [Clostridium thermobutyricum]|uniref:non-specific serine/threonine protein kinase n=1 Tax=Clostridium thermobutyricum DSM 4928 TaxID=1121339 RepID=A0A1V4SZD0_9CLOT|nr:Stk1 family PASTA domain-containing Ser/Thr kinase [Clostridium thermobutyricum]OPX51276.1 serine/threonine-protein kinase PrkC [Clostridium thermobutyricum DSM 4928]